MAANWRVMINPKLWDQAAYERIWLSHPEVRTLAQAKGKARMVRCPKLGDSVSFVLKGEIVMKGIMISDGFLAGTEHQEHSCHRGMERTHAEHPEFGWVKITEILEVPEKIRRTGQRTWARY